ncbi:MAG TPA: M28 family metallopeptidase [Solirubrobacterales bacterium]|nr:M28 family metallopeptidase [Solirubrobacterales bacterium]
MATALALVASGCGGTGGNSAAASAGEVPRPTVDRFNERAALRLLRAQVRLGPRPAGSPASRRLARNLARLLPRGRLWPIPGHPGLRNVIGVVPGRNNSRTVVVGAHYDTKDLPGFVGANDGASGPAVLTTLARQIRPRQFGPRLVFVLFDGEESPAGKPEGQFLRYGLRGSKAVAPRFADAEAMVLLDFVGERGLRLPRESLSNRALWERLRAAAGRVGVEAVFPPGWRPGVLDDHIPFRRQGVPSINLIDFEFECWHRLCDDLSVISIRSLDAVGEAVYELLRDL